MKRLELVEFFAAADEFDRLAGDRSDREGCTAAGIAVHFGQHHPGEIETLEKGFGGGDGILAGHAVGDKKNLRGGGGLLDTRHFRHHLLIDMETPGGVDDDRVEQVLARMIHGMQGDRRSIPALFREDLNIEAAAEHPQLFDGRRAVNIGRGQQGSASFFAQMTGELARKSGLA